MTFSIKTLSIMAGCCYTECPQCRVLPAYITFSLCVVMLIVFMLSAAALVNAAPAARQGQSRTYAFFGEGDISLVSML